MHVPCAGGIVFDASGRLLLVQRGQPPSAGFWSVPGGRCDRGERAEQTCVREVAEETGLDVAVLRWAGRVERDGPGGVTYDIDDFVCAMLGGELGARDDAAAVRWVNRAEFDRLPLVALLAETLRDWDCLPRR